MWIQKGQYLKDVVLEKNIYLLSYNDQQVHSHNKRSRPDLAKVEISFLFHYTGFQLVNVAIIDQKI